jgi:arylsulfatase A-like enzyme
MNTAWLLSALLACRGGDTAQRTRDEGRDPRPSVVDPKKLEGSRRPVEEIPRDKPETVVFIVMDTVRADHLSLCGYDRPTSPFLEHMRDEFGAAWSCDAYSPATWTMPSHTSYFTGTGLPEHKHDRLGGTLPDTTGPMLSEQMKAKGFVTMMFAANTALQKSGLQRGFDQVRIARDMTELREPNFADELERALSKADAGKPWFLFVNLIDAHDPYPKVPVGVSWVEPQDAIPFDVRKAEADTPYHDFLRGEMPAAQAERFLADVRDGYDWGVSREDEDVRHVLTVLRKLGRLPGPLRIVVTADHGELFGEGGYFGHGPIMHE